MTPLRALIVEDSEDDALLLVRDLQRAGYDVSWEVIQTAEAMQTALGREAWDVIFADYNLPRFSAPAALALLRESGIDIPFLVVSGSVGEEIAAQTMRAGAHDYILKGNMRRLAPAVERELEQAKERRARRQAERQYELLFDRNPEPMWVFDEETLAFLAVNDAACRQYGYTRQELLGMTIRGIRAPEDAPKLIAELANEPHELHDSGIWKHRTKDGTAIDVQIYSNPLSFLGRPAQLILAIDVTERLRAEREIRENATYLTALVANSPLAIVTLDPDHRVKFVNPAFVDLFGYSAEELSGRNPDELIAPDEPALRQEPETLARRVLSGESVHTSTSRRRKDGAVVDVELYGVPLISEGRLIGVYGIYQDITEQRRAEQALRTSEARKRAVLEAALDAIITIDETGRIIEVNPAAERTFGFEASEMLGRELASLIVPPSLRDEHRRGLERQRRTGEARVLDQVLEMPAMRRGGEEFPVELFISKVEVEGALHFVGYIRDMTERRKAERDTRRSEERFRRLFDSNTIGIAVSDLTGATFEANDAYLDMLGYTREELRSGLLRWDDITPPEYRAVDQAAVEALRRTGVAPAWEKEMLRKDGTRVPVLLGVAMLEASEVNHCIAYIVDLSKSRQLEKQLRQSQKMEAVGQLAGGVAHDFNNLLTAILGYTELAASRMGGDPSGLDELEEVRKAGERAAGLTRQLLAFSRRQVLEPRVLDLNAIVSDLEKMLRRLIGEDIDLVTTLHPSLGSVRADAGEIDQVIMNLALNSRDAMPGGGKITIETANVELDEEYAREHLITLRPGRYVMLAMSDTGIGMDAETQSHIFEPFFTTKAKDQGTGLGLSTVYGIVKQSGGWIWVYSEPGRGTTLKVYLPEVDEAAETVRRPVAAPPTRGAETVLLAEDEAPVRKLARKALENLGYTVLEASRGEEALSIARSHAGPIHLVLTDVVMPEMGGADLVSRVQELRPEARVLYMSGYTDDAIIRHKVLERGTHFLQKPFTPASLARKVREALS